MKTRRFGLVALVVALAFWPSAWDRAVCQTLQQQFENTGEGPIVIKSKSIELDDRARLVTFIGEVDAKRDDFALRCKKLIVHYESLPTPTQDKPGQTKTKIEKIVAVGDVIIERAEGGVATADKAVFVEKEQTVLLTGSPVVKQGEDYVEGDLITIYLKENRSVVKASEDKKVKAVIYPGGEKK